MRPHRRAMPQVAAGGLAFEAVFVTKRSDPGKGPVLLSSVKKKKKNTN